MNRILTTAVIAYQDREVRELTTGAALFYSSLTRRRISRCLAGGCRMNPRRHHPNTYQLLLACA